MNSIKTDNEICTKKQFCGYSILTKDEYKQLNRWISQKMLDCILKISTKVHLRMVHCILNVFIHSL